jgi:hypothetical protein
LLLLDSRAWIRFLVIASGLLALVPVASANCECERVEFDESFHSSDAVFLGTLEAFEPGSLARASVGEVFKGSPGKTVEFDLNKDCNRFNRSKFRKVGTKYIYFVTKSEDKWYASMCSRSRRAKVKGKALKKLRNWRDNPESRKIGSRKQRAQQKK